MASKKNINGKLNQVDLMNNITNEIICSNLDLAKIVIDFYTAEVTNPVLFEQIKKICLEHQTDINLKNNQGFIESGYFSLSDFSRYMNETKLNGGGYKIRQAELLVNKLSENHIINSLPELISAKHSNERRFKSGGDLTKVLYERNLILNIVCGWNFIINKFTKSVVKIENKDAKGDYSIGTGFYVSIGDHISNLNLIVTNKHVVQNASEISIYTKDNHKLNYVSIKEDEIRDLAFIELEKTFEETSFHFNPDSDVLDEIITIGYPSIPMTKAAFQLVHKGEINAYAEDYYHNKLLVFSAKTSSGNSGSPIIDGYGMVIGIVTEELFEKEQFYVKGKLPYYAGIPTEEIIKSLNKVFFEK